MQVYTQDDFYFDRLLDIELFNSAIFSLEIFMHMPQTGVYLYINHSHI